MQVKFTRSIPGLGEKIRRARLIDRRSLKDIASQVGISRARWYQMEAEKYAITEEQLRKIEEVLGIDLGISLNQPKAD
ncbi:MAG: helix-turn-helix transcriptional regulator [Cyanobacteria bacterium SBC]|nr:helix-turn-helix transcriptional regulator [Cyanobacteria bacterium SBC]